MAVGAVIYLCAIISHLTLVGESATQFQSLDFCPYTDFCTRNRTMTDDIPIGYQSCCPKCYCDRLCVELRDCCHDVNITSFTVTEMVPTECLSAVFITSYIVDEIFMVKTEGFRQKVTCPLSYTSNSSNADRQNIATKCEGGFSTATELDDILLVSNRDQHAEVFANKYCAECNGVVDTIKWNIKVQSCQDNLLVEKPTPDMMFVYVTQNCFMESIPPTGLQSIERVTCLTDQDNNNRNITCSLHGGWNSSVYGDELKAACEQSIHEQKFLDFSEDTGNKVYANFKCFLYNEGPEGRPADLCLDETFLDYTDDKGGNITIMPIMLLTGAEVWSGWAPERAPHQGQSSGPCDVDEIYDNHKNQCMSLTCPGHTLLKNGRCVPMSEELYGVPVAVHIRLFPAFFAKKPDNKRVTVHTEMVQSLQKHAGFVDVKLSHVLINEHLNESLEQPLLCIAVSFYLLSTREQPVDDVITVVKERLDKDIELNFTTKEFKYKMLGRIDFLNDFYFDNHSYTTSSMVLNVTPNNSPILEDLYACPHVIYDAVEYCTMQEILYNMPCLANIVEFEINSKLMDGFYILKPFSFGVCIDTLKEIFKNTKVDPSRAIFQDRKDTFQGEITITSQQATTETVKEEASETSSSAKLDPAVLQFEVLKVLLSVLFVCI